jgi:NADPH:quinone reductase-like Zn-dependent oxidoreductase
MKALTYHLYGDPDVLQLGEQPKPKVAPGEVLVRCAARRSIRSSGK